MDLNYLYLRRGVSLARASEAHCERSRGAHLALYQGYGARIESARREMMA